MPTMLAAFITGREKVEVREVRVPRPGPGEALVRVRACGICGTDLHFYQGQLPALSHVSPGHEFAGEIVAMGAGVTGFAAGQRVAVEPLTRCRDCAYCRTGRYHLCPKHVLLGTFAPGGLAQYATVPAYTLYALPGSLAFELAALAEPLAVAVHGLHTVGLTMGERVLVMGSGSVGLLAVLAARAAGAGEIVVTYRHDHQGEAALAAGADRVVKDSETAAQQGFDVVVETVGGTASTLADAVSVVRPGGRISVLGLFTAPVQLNGMALMLKEVTVAGAVTYCRPGQESDFDVALGILQSQSERARALITHRFRLRRAAEAFAAASHKGSGSLKVQVAP